MKSKQKGKDIKNVPNLRFPGFEGAWEMRRLGDISKFSKGKGISKSDIEEDGANECIRYGELYTHYGEVINEVKSKTNVEKTILVLSERNDVIIPASGETHIDIATASCVLRPGVALGGDLNIIKTKNNGVFLAYYLGGKKRQEIANLAQGNSVIHLYSNQLSNLSINLPEIEEQKKIGSLLTLIDKRIQTQNKIIEELQSLKGSFIKKLFLEELRFKDENGGSFRDWKDYTLGDIGDVKMCKRIFNDETLPNGDIPFFKIGSFGKEADAFITRELYMDYRKRFSYPKSGDILVSAAGTIGRTVVYKGEDAYYQDSNIVWIDNDNKLISNDFLIYILQSVKFNTEGGTIQRLYNNILKSTKFKGPDIGEQNKISNFLSLIDRKILVEKQLQDKYILQKKYLLEQVFI